MSVKEAALEIVKSLPEECSWDELMHRIYVRKKVEAGIKAADDGRLIPHEEICGEFRK
jgi:predicted transcriptional regulator